MDIRGYVKKHSNHIAVYTGCAIVVALFFGSFLFYTTKYLVSPESTIKDLAPYIGGDGTLAQDLGSVINGTVASINGTTKGGNSAIGSTANGGNNSTSSSTGSSGTGVTDSLLSKKLVWAHVLPVYSYTLSTVSTNGAYPDTFGSLYPLTLSNQSSSQVATTEVSQAKKEGVDGFSIDTAISPASDTAHKGMNVVYPYAAAADALGGFYVAPTIDTSVVNTVSLVQAALSDYCANAPKYKSTAHLLNAGGPYVIFTYNDKHFTTTQWATIRASAPCALYWVGDFSNSTGSGYNGPPTNQTIINAVTPTLGNYDAGYSFINLPSDSAWTAVANLFASQNPAKFFAGGIWAHWWHGYNSPTTGANVTPGTTMYQNCWARVFGNKLNWNSITTWNDFLEHSNIEPDSDMGNTLADLTAWYSAKFKDPASVPFNDARLYITTPQALYLNYVSAAESLVINPTSKPITVTVQLVDNTGAPASNLVTSQVAANSIGTATTPVSFNSVPTGHFMRAVATMSGGASGSLTSPPIIVYSSAHSPSWPNQTLYYSLSSSQVLSGNIGLSIASGNAQVTLPAGSYQFVDLLHDAALVNNFSTVAKSGPQTISLSSSRNYKTQDSYYLKDANGNLTDFYLYVARVISGDGKIGFSDPVYIGP